jgi:hypothetical protein
VPRSCTVCEHPKREEIDSALVASVSAAEIAGRYRTLGERAVRRHRSNHLPAKLVMAEKAAEVVEANTLLEQVGDLQRRALAILDQAERTGELKTALSAIREARGNLELLAKLLGELDERPVVNLNVSSEWLELRTAIVIALEPYSDARGAVLRAIEEASSGAA